MLALSQNVRTFRWNAIDVGVVLCVLVSGATTAYGQDANDALAEELYAEFRAYRIAISQEDSEPSRFFTRYLLEDVLQYVGPTPDQYDDEVVELFRSTLYFGLRILDVVEYRAYIDPETSADVLRLVCNCSESRTPVYAIELNYRREEDGVRRIELITFDTSEDSRRPVPPESIVESFPAAPPD